MLPVQLELREILEIPVRPALLELQVLRAFKVYVDYQVLLVIRVRLGPPVLRELLALKVNKVYAAYQVLLEILDPLDQQAQLDRLVQTALSRAQLV